MKHYKVRIVETLVMNVDVEAENAQEAEQIVSDRWRDSEYIRDLYDDWQLLECSRIHSMEQRYRAGDAYPELLIGNFDLLESVREKPLQMSFDSEPIDYEKILKESIRK